MVGSFKADGKFSGLWGVVREMESFKGDEAWGFRGDGVLLGRWGVAGVQQVESECALKHAVGYTINMFIIRPSGCTL